MKRAQLLSYAIGLLLLCLSSAHAESSFSVIRLTAGMNVIQAEVAARDADREQGLMFREKMAANSGMLFVFDRPAQVCMWMKNTLIPLSVAFLDTDGRILNIEDMKPQTLESHCARRSASFALEMNVGWFKAKNIKPGTVIGGLPNAQPPNR